MKLFVLYDSLVLLLVCCLILPQACLSAFSCCQVVWLFSFYPEDGALVLPKLWNICGVLVLRNIFEVRNHAVRHNASLCISSLKHSFKKISSYISYQKNRWMKKKKSGFSLLFLVMSNCHRLWLMIWHITQHTKLTIKIFLQYSLRIHLIFFWQQILIMFPLLNLPYQWIEKDNPRPYPANS